VCLSRKYDQRERLKKQEREMDIRRLVLRENYLRNLDFK
jgi:hypothetical protein